MTPSAGLLAGGGSNGGGGGGGGGGGNARTLLGVPSPVGLAFSGPTHADIDAVRGPQGTHTLPVCPLLPLSLFSTLEEFEDFFAEAIYAGSVTSEGSSGEQTAHVHSANEKNSDGEKKEGGVSAPRGGDGVGSGGGVRLPPHPKEEARARTAAAVARIRKLRGQGYFAT